LYSPKRFRIQFHPEIFVQSVKLNRRKIRYIINHKKKGESCKTIALNIKISKRRDEHIWKKYKETGKEPITKQIKSEEIEIIKDSYNRYKFEARMLEFIIEEIYNIHTPHNRIHMCLLSEGLAEENKQKEETQMGKI
jgi:transposase